MRRLYRTGLTLPERPRELATLSGEAARLSSNRKQYNCLYSK